MIRSLQIGWIVADISERIESSTAYVIDSLITMGLHIKTHDTIYIFSQIYSMVTHNMYGKHLAKRGPSFVNRLEERLRHDEKQWLMKATRVPMDTTTILSFDVIFETELDDHKAAWVEGYVENRKLDPNANTGVYTLKRIGVYLESIGHNLLSDFDLLQGHFEELDAITRE